MRWIELIAVGGEWTAQGVSQRQNWLETSVSKYINNTPHTRTHMLTHMHIHTVLTYLRKNIIVKPQIGIYQMRKYIDILKGAVE